MTSFDSELLSLKNLGMASVNILHAIGISSYNDLSRLGAVETYCRIKARGIHVSKVMLYALEGALLDITWNELTPAQKAALVEKAEQLERARA